MQKIRNFALITLLALLASVLFISPVAADETGPPSPAGYTRGTGTHFDLTDSPHMPVTVNTSASVTAAMFSGPEMVNLVIAEDATGSVDFTMSGLEANTLYYQYTRNGMAPTTITSDASGTITFTEDVTGGVHIWFRTQPSTYYIFDDATGGDCTMFGTWSSASKTCTLTQDVDDAIFIEADGITVDGAGYTSNQLSANYAVYADGYNDITVKNLDMTNDSLGIWALNGENVVITDNTISDSIYGVITISLTGDVIITNNVANDILSLTLYNDNTTSSADVLIEDNVVSHTDPSNYAIGIYYYAYQTTGTTLINNNTVSGFYFSMQVFFPNGLEVTNNTLEDVVNGGYALYLYNQFDEDYSVYNNNFINNDNQILHAIGTYSYNEPAPVGGNYFDDFDTPGEGCDNVDADNFCDAPYFFTGGQDNLPWTMADGWANQPPVADAGGPYSGDEGSAIALSGATASDADMDPLTYSWTVSDPICSFDDATVLNPTLTCGDNGSYTATLEVNDGTLSVTSDATVDVANVAPTITLLDAPVDPLEINSTADVTIDFTDPAGVADEPYTCTFDYDNDGTVDETVAGVTGTSCMGSNTYTETGVYTVAVTVEDKDGGSAAEIYEFVVIYDPDGGYVTGAGTFDSPAGAYMADPLWTGNAKFGMISQYRSNRTTPDGNAQFQISAQGFNFHSTDLEWLVIDQAAGTAIFQGIGEINGASGYAFTVWATDNGVGGSGNTFRIHIWEVHHTGDITVYDNGSESPITNGNITVDTGRNRGGR
ncbi:MAG: PKD domain-containing protein [Chloroflexota bacterium]